MLHLRHSWRTASLPRRGAVDDQIGSVAYILGGVLDQVLEDLSQRNLDLQQQLDNPQTYVIDVFNEEAVAVGTITAQFAVDATGLSLGITGTLGDAPASLRSQMTSSSPSTHARSSGR